MSPAFVATIQLYPRNSGGRSEALTGGEWQVLLAFPGQKASARLTFIGEPVPGEKFVATIHLLETESTISIPAGTKFIVWDGGTRGTGIVEAMTENISP